MKVKPLGDKLIVKRADPQDKTDSGIYLPESAKDKPREGEIIATGKGILNRESGAYLPFSVKTGDKVIFSSYSGTEIKIDNSDYLIMTEDDILGIIE
ncbi:MAG: co-chaperone GroES [Phycisphaerales bacterium]|jgi:chaperonin GroES|nr:co-chaperone GroES [Phycisphaerales bacterium]